MRDDIDLYDNIYDASVSPENHWPAALKKIADAFSSTDAALYFSSPEGSTLTDAVSGRISDDVHALYFSTYVEQDIQIKRLLSQSRERDLTGSDLLESQEEKLCPVHHEYLIPNEISSQLVWLINGPNKRNVTFVLMRNERSGEFDGAERQRFSRLVPHVRRSLEIGSTLAQAKSRVESLAAASEQSIGGAFTSSGEGVFDMVCNGALELFQRTPALEAFCHCAVKEFGRLSHRDVYLKSRTEVFVDSKNGARIELVMVRNTTSKTKTRSLLGPTEIGCTLRVLPLTREAILNRIVKLHGLSPAEGKLAAHLANGGSVSSFARARGTSIHTARNQLKTLLSKTQTHRQGELVAMLGSAFEQS